MQVTNKNTKNKEYQMTQTKTKSVKYTLLMTLPLLFIGCNETQKEPEPYENYYQDYNHWIGKSRCSIVQKVSGNTIISKDIETGDFKKFTIVHTYPTNAKRTSGSTRLYVDDVEYIYPNDTIGFSGPEGRYKRGNEFIADLAYDGGYVIFNGDSLKARKRRMFNQSMQQEISR